MTNKTQAVAEASSGLQADRDLLANALRAGGATALNYFRRDTPVYRKSDGSEITDADLAVNAELQTALCKPRREYGWLSEESADNSARLDAKRVWIVDPIDGTRAFILAKPHWVISAALVEDGEPVVAAIHNPVRNETFLASKGQGAELNGCAVKVSAGDDLDGAHILAPKSLAKRAGWCASNRPEVTTSFIYSIAYRMALVAAGYADGLISTGVKSEWDVAAGTLIVQEAGGWVSSADGSRYRFNKPEPVCNGTIAASPVLHGKLLAALR